ncbi:MAG: DUF6672 family protein [Exilispira sp.]
MNVNIKGIIVKIAAVLIYILLIVFLYNIGKGHTIYIFNQKFITSSGEEIDALYTCKIKNVIDKGAFVNLINNIFGKNIYKDQILTYAKGVPGQIVVPWHKKKVVFEYYDGKNLVKTIELDVILNPDISQYYWNLAALYAGSSEWIGEYIIKEVTDEEIVKQTEVTE